MTGKPTEDQERALAAMLRGENVFLTGGGGTGKSWVIEEFCKRKNNRGVAKLATTSAAAQLIGGQTVHSFFRCAPGLHLPFSTKVHRSLQSRIRAARTIIIEEVSMCRTDLFQMVRDRLFGSARGPGDFAGYQVICVGDFAQLPPVLTDRERETFEQVYSPGALFAFQNPAWSSLRRYDLVTQHRQAADPGFGNWLNDMRHGRQLDLGYINERVSTPNPDAITLTASLKAAERINSEKMAQIDAGFYRVPAKLKGDFPRDEMRVPELVALKPGARVIVCANGVGYVNGTTGTLLRCQRNEKGDPQGVILSDDGREIVVDMHKWENKAYGVKTDERGGPMIEEDILGSFEQLPILPGWAITIHRSQGMSLGQVNIDPAGIFEAGQTYVALSRARTKEGIFLAAPVEERHIWQDTRVMEFMAGEGDVIRAQLTAADTRQLPEPRGAYRPDHPLAPRRGAEGGPTQNRRMERVAGRDPYSINEDDLQNARW